MKTVICVGLLVCACAAYASALPVVTANAAAPSDTADETLVPTENHNRYKKFKRHGYQGEVLVGGGYAYDGGYGGDYVGGYGGDYGGGYGGDYGGGYGGDYGGGYGGDYGVYYVRRHGGRPGHGWGHGWGGHHG